MAGKWNTWENQFLQLIFQNTTPSLSVGNAGTGEFISGSSTAGYLHVALLTGDPGETGNAAANECNYTGYARVAVSRTTGWTVSTNTASNTAAITFGTCTAGSETATHVAICKGSTRATNDLLFYAELTGGGLAISAGVTPQIQASDLQVVED